MQILSEDKNTFHMKQQSVSLNTIAGTISRTEPYFAITRLEKKRRNLGLEKFNETFSYIISESIFSCSQKETNKVEQYLEISQCTLCTIQSSTSIEWHK